MSVNMKPPIPESFYIFVDTSNPLTVQALNSTRMFSSSAYTMCKYDKSFLEKYIKGSVRYLPFKKEHQDVTIFSPYYISVLNDFNVEYDAECVREKFFPLYPSRLSAVYAFGDYDTCIRVSKKYDWDLKSVRKFRLINSKLTRIIKVNMEIVSIARSIYEHSMLDEKNKELLWQNYWRGLSFIPTPPNIPNYSIQDFKVDETFEYLIEGSLALDR